VSEATRLEKKGLFLQSKLSMACRIANSVCLLLLLLSSMRALADPPWVQANASYYDALAKNPADVEPFLHPDFAYLTAYRTSLSKHQLLNYLERHQGLVKSVSLDHTQSWRVGDMALVTGFATTQGNAAQFNAVRSEYWHIWWFQDGKWTLRVRQASLDQSAPVSIN
jgi:hypothetical protein